MLQPIRLIIQSYMGLKNMFKRIFLILILLVICSCLVHAATFIQGPALVQNGTIVVKAAGTTTLTANSQTYQQFTGTSTQTVVLPDATTLPQGRRFVIINGGASGLITVQDAGANTIGTVAGNGIVSFYLSVNGSAAGTWYTDTNSVPTGFTTGSVIFVDGGGTLTQDNANFFWDDAAFRLGIGTASPTSSLSFGGNSARNIGMERNSTTTGSNLTISPGGAVSGGTDLNGGTLTIRSGISTGTGLSNISFQTYTPATATGTADNAVSTKMTLTGNGFLGIGTTTPTGALTVAASRSGTPGTGGEAFIASAHTFTDNNTAGSGTAANYVGNFIGAPILAATNSTVTTTTASNVRLNGPVAAGTNETLTLSIGLDVIGSAVGGSGGAVTNAVGLRVTLPSGATNNYAAFFNGSAGFGGMVTPMTPVDAQAQGVTQNSSEPYMSTSQRIAISSGNIIGGMLGKSDDTNLTAPGTIVAGEAFIAEATHTASVLDTGIAWSTTKTLSMTEKMRLTADGYLGIGISSSITSKLWVDGTADIVQTTIQGNATQTSTILIVEKSDGTDLLGVTNVNGTQIKGTTTNDAAATGDVAEYVTASQTTLTNFGATGVYSDCTSISLTAGDWQITGNLYAEALSGTVATQVKSGISNSSGNSNSGLVDGDTASYSIGPVFNSYGITAPVAPFRISLSGTSTYYLKAQALYSGTTPQFKCRISARRMR